jgi:hypothetical protein
MLIFNYKPFSMRLTYSYKSTVKNNFPYQKNIFSLIFFFSVLVLNAQSEYSDYFKTGRLRFDYAISSVNGSCRINPFQFYFEPVWGGSKSFVEEKLNYGDMLLEVFDSTSDKLLYSYGYSTLFKEWLTTERGKDTTKIFIETVLMPDPKKTIRIRISDRDSFLNFKEVYTTYFNPLTDIVEVLKQPEVSEVRSLRNSGDPSGKTDIVIISEGFTQQQKDKFFRDAEKFSEILFTWDPYKAYPKSFNIYAVFLPSEQPGADIPPDSDWVSTALNTRFYTFGSERYLTTDDMQKVRNAVSGIPYDQICIMVNSDKYGGGGIYNYYTVFTSDNIISEFLFMHEFGHNFASLADEYYTSQTAYVNMFGKNTEPLEPNITTLTSFDKKWKDMLKDTVPVPTLSDENYKNIIGVYEGAGYCEKGIYRPYMDCSMKSKINNAFCPVCKRAIVKMIKYNDPSMDSVK